MIDPKEIMEQAEAEVEAEQVRALIDLHKEKIRLRETFWARLFPWRIRIYRIDTVTEIDVLKRLNGELFQRAHWLQDALMKEGRANNYLKEQLRDRLKLS